MKFKIRKALSYDDLLLVPQLSEVRSRKDVCLDQFFGDYQFALPIIASPMDTISETEMVEAMAYAGGLAIVHRRNTIEEQCNIIDRVGNVLESGPFAAAIGVSGDYLERAVELVKHSVTILCLDVAHGNHVLTKEALESLRKTLRDDIFIIGGNVATANGFVNVSNWGADAVRVGQGGGAICSTRLNTGCGVPTAQSIIDCVEIREKLKLETLILADGGIKNAGDVVKACALGADYVIVGSLLAGTSECPGEIVEKEEKKYKSYRGMASKNSQLLSKKEAFSVEGVEVLVPFVGSVIPILEDIKQNICSGLSLCGARDLWELRDKAEFIQQTTLGMKETGTHINDRK